MLKKLYISFCLLFCCTLGFSQSTSPSVVGAGGGSTSINGYRIDYNIGELAIQTAGSNPMITEGFEQPEMGDVSLPVKSLTLRISNDRNHAHLYFSTRQEFKSDYFIVERSMDGQHFDTITKIKTMAPNGYSAVPLSYTYKDPERLKGKVYYRINQVDQNGDHLYSSVESISEQMGSVLSVFPSPATNQITVQMGNSSTATRIQVYSSSGALMYSNLVTGSGQLTIQLAKWPAGVYLLVADTQGAVQKTKFIKK